MINLPLVNQDSLDLSVSEKFSAEYHKHGAFPNGLSPYKFIVETEINTGAWFDNVLCELPDNAVIVDIGMNVGLFTLYLGAKSRKFYGIEPCEYHIEIAKELFEKLGYDVTVYKGVIYNKNGMVGLWEAPENTTSNRVGDTAPTKVESKTLKSFFDENGIEKVDFLKMDCEGSEKQIILQDPTIDEALKKCKTIFIETHCGDAYMSLEEVNLLVDKIVGLGFKCRESIRKGSFYFTQ